MVDELIESDWHDVPSESQRATSVTTAAVECVERSEQVYEPAKQHEPESAG
jgi:hypothetical protein